MRVWMLGWCLLAACGPDPLPDSNAIVAVSKGGHVALDDEPASIDRVVDWATHKKDPVIVRAHGSAHWSDTQYVLAALGEAGHRTAALEWWMQGKAGESVRVRVHSGRLRDGGKGPFCFVEIDEIGRAIYWRDAETHPLSELPSLDGHGALVTASSAAPIRFVHGVVQSLQRRGAAAVEFGMDAIHPSFRDVSAMPRDNPRRIVNHAALNVLGHKSLHPINAPWAEHGAKDRDNDGDDRLIVNVTASGGLWYRSCAVTLRDLRELLHVSVRNYARKRNRERKTGFVDCADGTRISRLLVLLRVDRDAPLRCLRWIMAECIATGLVKIQFAVVPRPTPRRNARDHAWLLRVRFRPLGYKLGTFRLRAPRPPDLDVCRIEADVGGWVVNGQRCDTRAALGVCLRREDASRTFVEIDGPGSLTFDHVIAAFDAAAAAGVSKVDLAGIKAAPEPLRFELELELELR